MATMPNGQVIPLNDPGRLIASLGDVMPSVAARVIASGRYILGTEVAAFEHAFSAYLGVSHAVGVANGTDALEIALRACGIQPGDGVLMCAHAGMYAAVAAEAIGAAPLFADIDDAGLLSEHGLDQAFDRANAPPRGLVVTHLYGRVGEIDPILAWGRKRRLRIVEDCAQAHGARSGTGMAGSLGDAAAFSFYPTKNLGAMGDAGMVVSGDETVATQARALREYGWASRYRAQVPGGRNSRLDELQAAFLREALPLLDTRNARRRHIAAHYSRSIRHPLIRLPPPPGEGDVAHLYVVRSQRRDQLASHLYAAGVGHAIHYPVPDYRQPAIAGGRAQGALPMTDAWCDSVLSLPCFPELHDAEVDTVIDACNRWAA